MTGSAHGESPPAGAGPETVRVVRPGHPLHGLDLPVWGRLRLRGVGHGGPGAARWQQEAHPRSLGRRGRRRGPGRAGRAVVAAAADLLRLLRVISGIPATAGNRAEQAARQSPGKEDDRAACTTQSAAGPGSGATIAAGQPAALAHRASRGRDRGTPDHPGGATRIAGRARNASPGAGAAQQEVSGGE